MKHLLNLLAAIALLVWGTYLVRTGILTAFGAKLRDFLARSLGNRGTGFVGGLAVTAVVQSSTATALIVSAFVGQGLLTLPLALAVMLGADVGTSIMAVMFSFDLSWLSPLLILSGVFLFLSRKSSNAGRIGGVLIGLGLMLLALRLVTVSTSTMTSAPVVRTLLASMTGDLLVEIVLGAFLSIFAFSSLAIVLLTSAMVSIGALSIEPGLGVVLGANLGSGLLAVLTTMKAELEVRQVPFGNLIFKVLGILCVAPFISMWLQYAKGYIIDDATLIVLFHLSFNCFVAALFIGLTGCISRLVYRFLPGPQVSSAIGRPRYLDPSALSTPSLAISCATREAMHQADVVETMLVGMLDAIKGNDAGLSSDLRKLDDTVDEIYSAIKYYLTKIPREALGEHESVRWADILSFSINMEQTADIIEKILIDVEEKNIQRGRSFSDAGMREVSELHAKLVENLQLSMSVFLYGSLREAENLLLAKAKFRELERAYSMSHLVRLSDNSIQSIESSSLHIDLISDMKRMNSHICSIAYPILEAVNGLVSNRLRSSSEGIM